MRRIEYLDRARAYGILLVYYTHFIERLYKVGEVHIALVHWKLICAFLMQFYFFLAGMFWKPAPFSTDVFMKKMKTRLLPSIFLSLLIAPLWFELGLKKLWKFVLEGGYLLGRPLNTPLWYLICLMSTELLAALIIKYFRASPLRIFIYALISFCFGYYILVGRADYINQMTGINPGIWYIDDAFIVVIFFFFGYLSREALAKADGAWGWRVSLIVTPAAALALWQTYQWNVEAGESVLVLISASQYGNIWYFLLASLVGIVFLLALSRLVVINASPVSFVAQNSLIYLGLNGICFHFLDQWAVRQIFRNTLWLPQTFWQTFAVAFIYALTVVTLFIPLVWIIRRWFPELSGFEWAPTSLLPPIREWGHTRLGLFLRPFFGQFLNFSNEENNNGRSLS
jgi:hypothetical protein